MRWHGNGTGPAADHADRPAGSRDRPVPAREAGVARAQRPAPTRPGAPARPRPARTAVPVPAPAQAILTAPTRAVQKTASTWTGWPKVGASIIMPPPR